MPRNTATRRLRFLLRALAGAIFVAAPHFAQAATTAASAAIAAIAGAGAGTTGSDTGVSATTGANWLARFGQGTTSGSIGKMGSLGQKPGVADPVTPQTGNWLTDGVDVSGADLYRYNCRSCHGMGAQGLRNIIPSIVDAVQLTSPDRVQQQANVSGAEARQVAQGANLGIRHRLKSGGSIMPPFGHLREDETQALLGYLASVAGIRASEAATRPLRQRPERIGEHIVRATCHTCHDAVPGYGKSAQPALSAMTTKYSVSEFAATTRGRSGRHGSWFGYLSEGELKAAYVYLMAYPPEK